jgi:hypothetical protein
MSSQRQTVSGLVPKKGKFPSGPAAGKPSLTCKFHFNREIKTRTGRKMCAFEIGCQKCISFNTLAKQIIEQSRDREGQDLIVVGRHNRHRDGEFIVNFARWVDRKD